MTLLDKIKERFYAHPLMISLFLAIVLRIFAAFYNYGPAAIDDYANIIMPPLRALQTGQEMVVSEYRFNLFPYIIKTVMTPFWSMGIDNPRWIVSLSYMFLAMLSLFGVWGTFRLGENLLSKEWRNYLTLLSAIYFLAPFFTTRAYLGSFALSSMPWAFYFLTKKEIRAMDFFWGAFFLALSTYLRITTGVLFFVTLVYFVVQIRDDKFRKLSFFILGGFVMLITMGGLDMLFGRPAFSTIMTYITVLFKSQVASSQYGYDPWYSLYGGLLIIFIPPFSLVLLYSLKETWKKEKLLILNIVLFIIIHSWFDEKLDRFLLPIIPLFMAVTLVGVEQMWDKKIIRFAYKGFFITNLILLLPVLLAASQMSIVDGALAMRDIDGIKIIKPYKVFWTPAYLGYDRKDFFDVAKLEDIKPILIQRQAKEFHYLNFMKFNQKDTEILKKEGIQCSFLKEFHPALMEKVVIFLNPKHNTRRKETALYKCVIVK